MKLVLVNIKQIRTFKKCTKKIVVQDFHQQLKEFGTKEKDLLQISLLRKNLSNRPKLILEKSLLMNLNLNILM